MRNASWFVIFACAAACASATGDEAPEVVSGGAAGAPQAGGAAGDAGASGAGAGGSSLPDGGAFPDASAAGAAGSPFPDASTAGAGGGAQAGTGGSSAGTSSGGAGQSSTGGAAGQPQAGAAGSPSGPCAGKADGTVCDPTTSPCKTSGACAAGVCQPITNKPDGTVCDDPKSPCQTPGVCAAGACGAPKAKPDETVPDPASPYTRCCGGVSTKVTTSSRCGSCAIACNASNGESCQARSNAGETHYYCAGCVASVECWSGCCSTSYPATMNVCAASDCKGGCTTKCPKGTHCQAGASVMMSNWCEPD